MSNFMGITHKDVHVAAAVDGAGRLLGAAEFGADAAGYRQLLGWLESWGAVRRVGVEGTGSYGAGLARHLRAAGAEVAEVNRPNRQMRRLRCRPNGAVHRAGGRAHRPDRRGRQPGGSPHPGSLIVWIERRQSPTLPLSLCRCFS